MDRPAPILIYRRLRRHFGFRDWWPGDSDFEVLVGAVLTQQTTWKNVEKAIANLKEADSLSMEKIASMDIRKLERLIRPSGYYRQKAKRLKGICARIKKEHGSLGNLLKLEKNGLRKELLSYNGIGMETADSIILYAAEKPVFVIDAYTKRAMHRIDPSISADIEYEQLRGYFEERLEMKTELYNDFHAQFVELGKRYCTAARPSCGECPLRDVCHFGAERI
ncbi:MAG: endonuclease [Candidatus Micrarchaeaceae archaeon]